MKKTIVLIIVLFAVEIIHAQELQLNGIYGRSKTEPDFQIFYGTGLGYNHPLFKKGRFGISGEWMYCNKTFTESILPPSYNETKVYSPKNHRLALELNYAHPILNRKTMKAFMGLLFSRSYYIIRETWIMEGDGVESQEGIYEENIGDDIGMGVFVEFEQIKFILEDLSFYAKLKLESNLAYSCRFRGVHDFTGELNASRFEFGFRYSIHKE